MSTERDVERIVRSWMDEGVNALPDRVLDLVLDQVPATPQRRAGWLARRFPPMNSNIVRFGIAAVVIALAVVVGINFLPGPNTGSPPEATPSPSATAEPTLSPASAPPLTQSFTSTHHGISLSYPEGWIAQAATEPWTDSTFPLSFQVPQVDWLYDPTLRADLFLAIASQPIGDSTPEDWVAEQMASDEGCGTTEPIAVDGGTGLIGAGHCDVAVVTTAGRGYWIQLYTSGDDPLAVAPYDRAWFEEVLATVALHPEDAVDTLP
ncbi:MAG: hypothetical protein WEB29_01690 [Chloroflexota bacterium]